MKVIFLAIAATMSVTDAFACPVSDTLAKRYGISFSGFDTPIPGGFAGVREWYGRSMPAT
ncbi:hypothetical protein [Massilia sp. BSC265]|uniref:hypothetical protein n=1 Tax=Massilia sp. BSC265 TaxID=1549812 RepID=UPI0004E8A135|nr:hypothetical protein [Massilia sp. BSC265]KFI07903.1 hypothetical protein JN27_07075 [Massilia sp. BSC265]